MTTHWLPYSLRIWSAVSLVMFLIMTTHQSDAPTIFARYSNLIAFVLLGLLTLTVVTYGAAGYLSRHDSRTEQVDRRLRQWRTIRVVPFLIVGLTGIAVFAVYLFVLGDHLPTYAALRAFLALSILMLALAMLTGGDTSTPPTRKIKIRIIIIGLSIPVLLALFASTIMPPLLKTDEAFTLSMGINLRDFGDTAPLIYKGIYADHYAWGGLWLRGLALWIQVVGEGLAQGRHYILLAGFLATTLTGIATARLYDRATACYTAIIMAFMVLRLSYLRPDMFVALYLSTALVAYAYAKPGQRILFHFLTGFFIGLCIDAAPLAYIFGVAAAILYLGRFVQAFGRDRIRALWPLIGLGMGGGLAILVYLLTRSGTSWFTGASLESDYLNTVLNHVKTLTPTTDLNSLLTALAPLTLLAIIGSAALVKQRSLDRGLVVIVGIWLCFIPFFAHYFPAFYAVHGLPLLAILAGVGVTQGITRWLRTLSLPPTATIILLTLWLSAWAASWATSADNLSDVVEAGRQIAQTLPPEARIVAAEPYYFGMLDNFQHTFRGGAFEQNSVTIAQHQADTAWADFAPDYIIFSQNWPQEPARTPALLNYMQTFHFERIGCWQTTAFGLVEVWGQRSDSTQTHLADCPKP